MLEGLDDINWQRLTHAYGQVPDVPELIRDLTSPAPDIRERALEGLRSTIWHQGTVYEAPAYAVPFLIELLENQTIQCRDEILIVLAHLAHGGPMYYAQEADDWVNDAHYAIAQGLDVYLSLLEGTDQRVRRYIPFVLSVLEEHVPSVISVLHHHLMRERPIRR